MSAYVSFKFFSELNDEGVIKRYNEKLQLVDCSKDPFCLLETKTSTNVNGINGLTYCMQTSTITSLEPPVSTFMNI